MTYTTTLKRTRKVNARDEARKRFGSAANAHWYLLAIDDLLDHEVEVTEDVEVQHRFKVGDRIRYYSGPPHTIEEIVLSADTPCYRSNDLYFGITRADGEATLIAPKRRYRLTVEQNGTVDETYNIGLTGAIEHYASVFTTFTVTDITSEVVE